MGYRQKIYLILAVSAVIIIGLLFFLISPLVVKVKESSALLKEKSSLLASYQEKGGDYSKRLRVEYVNLQPKIAKIRESFVNSERVIDFILAVEQAAALTSNYQEIRELAASEEKNTISFQVSLWGSFSNLIKFLARIENLGYFVNSDSLQITRIGERDLRGLEDKGIVVSIGDVKSVLEIKTHDRKY